MSIKNDGHYFCRAGGNRPDGLNEPVTFQHIGMPVLFSSHQRCLTVRD
nr:copper resistance protein [Escherichia coli]MDN1578132.1 copper resistance protein [Escherichia coli]